MTSPGPRPGMPARRWSGASSASTRLLRQAARLVAVLLSLLAAAHAGSAPPCQALSEQRDQRAREAMGAEIALLHTLRLRLCPHEEAQAAHANALSPAGPAAEPLDYERYIQCRRQAEHWLESSRPVLYRNRRGFTFYSADGARRAREADGLELQRDRDCPAPASATLSPGPA